MIMLLELVNLIPMRRMSAFWVIKCWRDKDRRGSQEAGARLKAEIPTNLNEFRRDILIHCHSSWEESEVFVHKRTDQDPSEFGHSVYDRPLDTRNDPTHSIELASNKDDIQYNT